MLYHGQMSEAQATIIANNFKELFNYMIAQDVCLIPDQDINKSLHFWRLLRGINLDYRNFTKVAGWLSNANWKETVFGGNVRAMIFAAWVVVFNRHGWNNAIRRSRMRAD